VGEHVEEQYEAYYQEKQLISREKLILLTAFTKPKFEIINNRSIVVKSVQLHQNFYCTY
jgi:hypothetical protein